MYLDVFDRNPYGTNCWLLGAEGAPDVVVVDPGFEPEAVAGILEAAGRRPAAVLLTHAHLDHAGTAGTFAGDIPVYVHRDDRSAFDDYQAWGGMSPIELDPVRDLRTFADGDVLHLAGLAIEVLHTPGHTPGSSCLRVDDDALVCSGDLVFAGTIGRSDFPNSDPAAMRSSLARFLTLPDELRVLPGHGAETVVGRERASNPFLQGVG
jgi:glyoxylase-like metal-dependent hydrolase (beta-lactamase superfamily II)